MAPMQVAEMLFEDTNDVVISMIVDFNKVAPTRLGQQYLHPSHPAGFSVEGQTLIDNGLPELSSMDH